MTNDALEFSGTPTKDNILAAVQKRPDLSWPVGSSTKEIMIDRAIDRFCAAFSSGAYRVFSDPEELIQQIVEDVIHRRSGAMAVGTRANTKAMAKK